MNHTPKQHQILSFINSYTLHHFGLNSDIPEIAEQAILSTRYKLKDLLSVLNIPLENYHFTCKHGSFIVNCDPSLLDRIMGNETQVSVKFEQNFKLK